MTNNQEAVPPGRCHIALCRAGRPRFAFRLPVGPERPRWLYQSQTVYII